MIPVEQLELAITAWHAAIDIFCSLQAKGQTASAPHGSRTITSGIPVPTLNGVISPTRQTDVAEMHELAARYRDEGRPWSIQLRGDTRYPAIEQVAVERGLNRSFTLPFMTRRLGSGDLNVPAIELASVRQIHAKDHALYNAALAAGYQAPEHVFRGFSSPAVLSAPGMSAFVVEEMGIPVATSFGCFANDQVGVFNISTRPISRRRGYARLATAAVLRDARLKGARAAFLHCTSAGRPLYESLGFEAAEEWLVYAAG
jgi:hypothetical protein